MTFNIVSRAITSARVSFKNCSRLATNSSGVLMINLLACRSISHRLVTSLASFRRRAFLGDTLWPLQKGHSPTYQDRWRAF